MVNRTFRLHTPVCRAEIESLELDDVIYLSGKVFTLRDLAHQRIERLFQERRITDIPFSLKDLVVFHGSLVVTERAGGGWNVVSAGATSSSRFSPRTRTLLEAMAPSIFVGKGTLTKEAIGALREHGAVYFQAVGGCAALYASKVKKVMANHWPELGMVDSVWELEVEDFGPLTVGIDCKGNSAYERLRESTLRSNLFRVYKELGIDPASDFVWWPRAAAGSRQATEYAAFSKHS